MIDDVHVSELFLSIQGEGRWTGTPSVFVRTTGCNLRCTYCDTPYTSWDPQGVARDLEDVVDEVLGHRCEHVVLTGGEPLLLPEIVPLSERLRAAGLVITVETAGTVDRPVVADLMSISPKRPNSDPPPGHRWRNRHQSARHQPDVIRRLCRDYDHQLKFVIDQPDDLEDVTAYLAAFPEIAQDRVWLMPQGVTAEALAAKHEWLSRAAERLGYRYAPRRHIEMFGHVRGT